MNHGHFLQNPHSWSCFAGVEQLCAGTADELHPFLGLGGDAAHALHNVEYEALGSKNGASGTFDVKGDVAGLNGISVVEFQIQPECRIDLCGNALGYFNAAEDACFFDQ